MTGVVLPTKLHQVPTASHSSRNGAKVRLVVVHRWGVPYINMAAEARSYQGVINWFKDPKNQVSAHIVFPGSAVPGEATQMVKRADKAWAEGFYNPVSMDIESDDAIWLGKDPQGMRVLARIVAFELHQYDLPALWVRGQAVLNGASGFCRHADLGSAGGGHTMCPTTDISIWYEFVRMVKDETVRGDFRKVWDK